MKQLLRSIWEHPRLRRYTSLVQDDLTSTYARDLHKWLIIAPILGVLTGLLITGVIQIILKWLWPAVLHQILAHPLAMVPTVTVGFLVAGLIMQYWTPDPNEHSTEEIIRSYHEHQGAVEMRPFVPKLLAAIATVGFGGSAALEGPSIYGGGSIGSWVWTKMRRLGLGPRDRRIMLISGAAAGMSAVFRAPLTGIIFALEMPYKDDLAHEALMPSLIASVVSYATMAAFLGSTPLFDFGGGTTYTRQDLLWSAVLGAACGLAAMTFDITFRRFRGFCVRSTIPHWVKMTAGGVLTGFCGLAFLALYPGTLVPLGPNYEAASLILQQSHGSVQLVAFGVFKLLATLFSLGVGGVSAMFVPLFLSGSSFGVAFGQSVVHTVSPDLYAAVGTAAFIAAGYKAPLTAVVFVAEATGGHAFIIPALIGAAIAYGVSGEASVSGDQRLHEGVRVADLANVPVSHAMQRHVRSIQAERSLADLAEVVAAGGTHALYPVLEGGRVTGTIAVSVLNGTPQERWAEVRVKSLTEHQVERVAPGADLQEALRILLSPARPHMVLVVSDHELVGVLTKSDVLSALGSHSGGPRGTHIPGEWR
ncbi:MAG TPA: chloride channel protein [Gemmatimonadales bacterium]|nr:chloride channel protein [Gemmatimonadales bacterium]